MKKLWLNKEILVDSKPIEISNWQDKGITKIYDILNQDLSLKSRESLNQEYNVNLDIMSYNQLTTAIPKHWLRTLKREENLNFVRQNNLCIKLADKSIPINKITSKDYYWDLINRTKLCPTAVNKWEELFYYVKFDWKQLFSLPYQVTLETSLQSMQYQILNRYYPCQSILYIWHKSEDGNCKFCPKYDTLEHYFFECEILKSFWNNFTQWWYGKTECNFELGHLDVLFGEINELKEPIIDAFNYCLLFAKKYISMCKLNEQQCIFQNFISYLLKKLIVLDYHAELKGKSSDFNKKFGMLMK